jgi:hypothetical protein
MINRMIKGSSDKESEGEASNLEPAVGSDADPLGLLAPQDDGRLGTRGCPPGERRDKVRYG